MNISLKLTTEKKLAQVINERIKVIGTRFEKLDDCTEKTQFLNDYSERAKIFAEHTFDCSITKALKNLVNELLYLAFRSNVETTFSTGVVVTGYGSDQFFPELIDYQVDGKYRGFVRVWVGREEDLNKKGASTAVVVPFAQSDMFQLFMEGITQNHLTFVHNLLIHVLNDKSERLIDKFVVDANKRSAEIQSQKMDNEEILKKFFEEFSDYVQQEMIQPVVRVISTLPKEEMAAMAEALVEITTLRRKVDSTVESVGGPTDVAIISKGDGLVWVKRKHYFNIDMNHDFLRRKRFRHGGRDGSWNEEQAPGS